MKRILQITFFMLISVISFCQQVMLLKNINPGAAGSFNFGTDTPTFEYKDRLYFVANSPEFGIELWVYDGEKTELFKDINPGANSAVVDFIFQVGDKMVFAADDGVHGYELWVSDGTPENTKLMIDLLPGSGDGLSKCCYTYSSRFFHVFNNELYFNGNRPNFGIRFFKTDGTAQGTVELAALNGSQRQASGFLEWKGNLYFEVLFEGFWKTDGTPSGTKQIKEGTNDFEPNYLTDMGEYILMANGYDNDIWISDGTLAGTKLVKKMFHPAAVNNVGHYFLRFGNKAYFPGSNPASNTEMWKTDGTELGTVQVSEIEIAINPFIPEYPKRRVVLKDKIYYLGGNQELGSQIFVIDPITDKTELLIDLKDKINGQVYFQTDLVANEKHIFFVAGNAFDRELWYSDGTEAGTFEVEISTNGESTPERLTLFKDKLFFFAQGNSVGYEPHVLDLNKLISSTKNYEKNGNFFFPNPVFNQLNLILENTIKKAEVFDIAGRLEAVYYDSESLNVSNLNPGMKFIRVLDSSNTVHSSRFLKM
ncbi:MAG: T9SS type A sorting domain-containing protein [Saprospiraceae bacterium]|nr:T9SS type A sorting domain-containing protein [Saprospiraceae bacterium]